MTSQPATLSRELAPDRLFGPFDRERAQRLPLPPAKAAEAIAFPQAARDASPSYCAWPSALVFRS